ncbi:hypothetical protein K3G63_16065 [Hymenobacter sp. HSC-4F20]|uniref:hypothetical protein n=1 Tax=Hymenobacter sp. HSC-4F20 TaxID=2864135 RepID=UPI001C73A9E5|nr:hypothetical protein [Hymenobacter sp. HSC-4F20]MBX0291969.1 hypothetical protein [Hymenobacter sp. HSC-4F20]
MLRSFVTWLLILTTAALLAACCGSTACECEDAYADAIGLAFSPTDSAATNPARGFRSAQLTTVFLVRVPLDTSQRPSADTVAITRPRASVFTQPIVINNATPFTQAGNRRLNQYTYTLYLAPSRRALPTYTYHITDINLATEYQADGCCTCYQNTRKQVTVLDQQRVPRQFDLTDPAGENQLVPIVLTRP